MAPYWLKNQDLFVKIIDCLLDFDVWNGYLEQRIELENKVGIY